MSSIPSWTFIDDDGAFEIYSAELTSALYFPLVNQSGMMSAITPTLHGDIKTGQHSFLTRPVSIEDLHESRANRNFWINIQGYLPWSAAGCSAKQTSQHFLDDQAEGSKIEAGLLWHRLFRKHAESGLMAEITNFVPASEDTVELAQIVLTNPGTSPLSFSTSFAVPIFGRSADHLRDHRHVTSLLNEIHIHPHGVIVQPTLVFDESGHHPNQTRYAVMGAVEDGSPPAEIFPLVDQFIGEGGTLDWPEAVVHDLTSPVAPGQTLKGVEALGGIRFPEVTLGPGESISYIIILGIGDRPEIHNQWLERYGSSAHFSEWLSSTRQHWKERLDQTRSQTGNQRRDGWTRWVSVQPILRKLFGNSFLPYHDYGRGGRGWRDLWQDILGLLLLQPDAVEEMLVGNFAGVRFDGSNATIIGHQPGEFFADRNNIPRVWMDHGAWPLFTTRMYIDWTGNLDILLQEQSYFKDHLTHRSQSVDSNWSPDQGTQLQTKHGEIYRGSIFEHLLIQNMVQFFNVGEHNCIRLEGADWNDALDMASERGESVAFTAFYAGNLAALAELADQLVSAGKTEIALAKEIQLLLDSLDNPIKYNDPAAKQERLTAYLNSCAEQVSGEQISINLISLASDLKKKAAWMNNHLRSQEWIDIEGLGWFNGYYDNQGNRVEGINNKSVQMTLTGQVFQLLFGIATDEQASKITQSVNQYLYDPALRGVRLNTEFNQDANTLGRMFGFAFGHKENGAMFSHMAVMYAYALFNRKLYPQANQLMEDLYQHCQSFPVSRIYPGIPEYLDPRGRGMYPYLTGAASWYLLTLVTQMYGIRGVNGDLLISPALPISWFDEKGQAILQSLFANRRLRFVIHNPFRLEAGDFAVDRVTYNEADLPTTLCQAGLLIKRQQLLALPDQGWQQLDVYLKKNEPDTAPEIR